MGKLVDRIIIAKEGAALISSDLQFAYKKGFSTSQCTYNLVETISYYNYRKSYVYVVLLDASKAFDRVDFVKLFEELQKRNLNPLVVRFLLQMYITQSLIENSAAEKLCLICLTADSY